MSAGRIGRYKQVQLKEFHSTIPTQLLDRLTEIERHLVSNMSRFEAQSAYIIEMLVQNNEDIRDADGRLALIEEWYDKARNRVDNMEEKAKESSEKLAKISDWKEYMSGRWAVLWALLLIVAPVVLKYLFDILAKKP